MGVIYQPSSGDPNEFINELHNILSQLPNKPTYIMGDFNIDLFKTNEPIVNHFEEIFLCQGFYPLISVATHVKPHCSGTCIDNTLTNNIDSIEKTGIIHDMASLHSPIFTLSQINLSSTQNTSSQSTQYYSYCKNNIQKLLIDLEARNLLGDNPNEPNFSHFINEFNDAFDKACKLEKPKTSKRTPNSNPWITDSIIDAINNKQTLYKQWKKTCCKKLPKGDAILYEKFSNHRRCVKKIIKYAK